MNSSGFSIAMCTYNGARFLSEQLESIAAQTLSPDEIVICDDVSADATTEIVRDFASRTPIPVRLFINEQNLGSTRNFARAIGLCQGQLIALSDQDDVWLPQKLERLAAMFDRQPGAGMVFSDAEVVDEKLCARGPTLWNQIGFDATVRQRFLRGQTFEVLLPGWTVTGATAAFRSTYRDLILPIPTNLSMIHDGWIALVIAAVAEVALIEEPLIKYRQHAAQQIGAPERAARSTPLRIKSLDGLQAAMRHENSYDALITIGEQVKERLLSRCADFDCGDALSRLDQRLAHLRTRSRMPGTSFSRLAPVFRELFAGRYHRYSTGFRSAAKDLFRDPSRSLADRQR